MHDKCLKMTEYSSIECNSYETHNIYPNLGVPLSETPLSDQQQFTKSMKLEIVLLLRLKKEN